MLFQVFSSSKAEVFGCAFASQSLLAHKYSIEKYRQVWRQTLYQPCHTTHTATHCLVYFDACINCATTKRKFRLHTAWQSGFRSTCVKIVGNDSPDHDSNPSKFVQEHRCQNNVHINDTLLGTRRLTLLVIKLLENATCVQFWRWFRFSLAHCNL